MTRMEAALEAGRAKETWKQKVVTELENFYGLPYASVCGNIKFRHLLSSLYKESATPEGAACILFDEFGNREKL